MAHTSYVRPTLMEIVGLVMAVTAAALLVWGSEEATGSIVLGVIGILLIAVGSRDRRGSIH